MSDNDRLQVIADTNNIQVNFDPEDAVLPICVSVRTDKENAAIIDPEDGYPYAWAGREEAVALARTILTALGENASAPATKLIDGDLNVALIEVAKEHGRVITFGYAKGRGAVLEQRSLIPYEVKDVGDHKNVIGYDPDRDEPRAFRLDRIKGEVSVL